jgi:DNA repair exonuclease SbcCD nuclease subunit
MKIALITDTHFGARGDSIPFDEYFKKFYSEVFFPELEKRNITTVFHLGDVFDRRKFINFNILNSCKQYFFDELKKRNLTCYMLAGNHDTYFKNTNEVNSPELLISKEYQPNVKVFSTPEVVTIDNFSVLMLPWICSGNYEEVMEVIKSTLAPVVFSHLELAGFCMYRGVMNEHGMDPSIFNKFDLVCSGHFHTRSSKGNITYIGNPYPMTWNDYEDVRGFTVMDTDTLEMEVVRNPHDIFIKYKYDDISNDEEKTDMKQFANKLVKLVIINKTNFFKYDLFIDRLNKQNPIELKIIEDFSEFEADALDDDNLNLEDTITLLNQFVDGIETDADKPRIKSYLKDLYLEAQTTESI